MTQFLADIAGMLEIFAIAGGFVLLHHASQQAGAKLLKVAGLILVLGGAGAGLCTGWYWLKYQQAGAFEHASSMQVPTESGSVSGTHMMPGMH